MSESSNTNLEKNCGNCKNRVEGLCKKLGVYVFSYMLACNGESYVVKD